MSTFSNDTNEINIYDGTDFFSMVNTCLVSDNEHLIRNRTFPTDCKPPLRTRNCHFALSNFNIRSGKVYPRFIWLV